MATTTYTNFNARLVHENRGGTQRDHKRDPLGPTAALLNVAGNESDRWEYWPYGEVVVRSGTNPTPFTILGTIGYFRDLSNTLYVRARHLRADFGRWLSVDPLWPAESAYSYAYSSPTKYRDPTGTQAQTSDCPAPVKKWLEKLCSNLSNITDERLERINSCISRNSGRTGKPCPGLSKNMVDCMKNYCANGDIKCFPHETPSGSAGTTIFGNPFASWIYGRLPSVDLGCVRGTNRYDYFYREIWVHNVIIGGKKVDVNLRDLGLIFLHELGHVCGMDHGDRPDDWQCNDVL